MPKDLRIIYMGTPDFAVPSLDILVENGYNIVAVITAPDKPAGRGLKVQESAVKQAAVKHGIPVLQPKNLKAPEFIEELKSYQANLQIVVAFRMLPEMVWNIPSIGTFNLHGSLLPQYRGAAPINWAVMNGEKETGVTTFFLKHEIDTGDLLLQDTEPIHYEDTAGSLYARLMQKGAQLVLKTVQQIENDTTLPTPQVVPENLKKAPKIFKGDCEVDFSKTADEVYNFVRGLAPYPTAWMKLKDKRCKVFTVKAHDTVEGANTNAETGSLHLVEKEALYIKAKEGWVSLEELQMEGKKRMKIQDFLRGFSI